MKMKILSFCGLAILLLNSLSKGEINQSYNERAMSYLQLLNCEHYETSKDQYENYKRIDNLSNVETPSGYILRFPIFIIGNKNAHVVFSATDSPNWANDRGYEFLFGGWNNKRMVIRSKKGDKEIGFSETGVLLENLAVKLLIEITNTGYLNVYLKNETVPVMSALDPEPVNVRYVAFKSHENTKLEFFYNCPSTKNMVYATPSTPPQYDGNLLNAPVDVLLSQCRFYEAWNPKENSTIAINTLSPNGWDEEDKIRLELYLFIVKNAKIILSPNEKTGDDIYYEIEIRNTDLITLFHRNDTKYDRTPVAMFRFPEYPTSTRQTKLVIDIFKNGFVNILSANDAYRPMISVKKDDNVTVNVNYIGLSADGDSRALYFYGCPATVVSAVVPPRQYDVLPDDGFDDKALEENCVYLKTQDHALSQYYRLSSLPKWNGYLIRLPFYAKAYSASYIRFTSGFYPDDQNYEFVLDFTYITVKKNGEILEKVLEQYVLVEYRFVKIVLEVTDDGQIRIFTDYNKSRPLLEVHDPNPIRNLRYVSFGNRIKFNLYHNCTQTAN